MKNVKLAALLIVVATLLLLVVQNSAPVQARFLWMSAEVSVVLLLFVTAAGGFLAGMLTALLGRTNSK